MAATIFNSTLLETFGYNLNKLITTQPNSIPSSGPQFRKPETLAPLLDHLLDWKRVGDFFRNSINYPLRNLPPNVAQENFDKAFKQGNRTSAYGLENKATLRRLAYTNVILGFGFLITQGEARKLKTPNCIPLA